MVFPSTAAPTVTTVTTASTTHNITMPATVNSGDLLLAVVVFFIVGSPPTITTPTGWTQLFHTGINVAGDITHAAYAKVADGTEDGTTVNFATDTSTTGIGHAYRATDWFGTLAGVEAATPVTDTTGSSLNPNPPSLTPSWGSADTLWFGVCAASDDAPGFGSTPANYTATTGDTGLGANASCEMGTAFRQLATATEDPTSYGFSSGEFWIANTIAVRPAAGATEVTLSAVATGSATLNRLLLLARTFSATVTGSATLARLLLLFRTFPASATGLAALVVEEISTALTEITLAAAAIGSATMARLATFARTLSATVTGSATLARLVSLFRTLSTTATGSATLSRVLTASRTLRATATGAATLIRGAAVTLTEITLSATTTAVATIAHLYQQFVRPFTGHGGLGMKDGPTRWTARQSTWKRRPTTWKRRR